MVQVIGAFPKGKKNTVSRKDCGAGFADSIMLLHCVVRGLQQLVSLAISGNLRANWKLIKVNDDRHMHKI